MFFHRGSIFKTVTSNGEQGVAVFNEGARCFFFFFFSSQHLCFRSHGLERPRMNNVRRASGTDERQRCQHTSSIRAGSPSITRAPQLRPTPSKHITKARDYFWKHDSTTAAMRRRERGGRAHSHKNNTASAASSLWRHEQLSAFLPSLCRRACWRHRPPVAEIF